MRAWQTFDFKGNTVKYFTVGASKEFVVLLQGWATKSELYSSVIDTLSEKYTVIFPALSGFGESDEPSSSFCVDDYADLVDSLLRSLGVEKAKFFCHSYGGRVFFKLNARENRFTAPESVILCDVAGVVPKKSLYKKLKIKLYKIGRRMLSTRVARFFFPDALEELRRKNGSADYNSATPVMRETLVRSVNEDLSHLFDKVGCSALIMWGSLDDAVPLSDAYLIDSKIDDSAVIEFKESGHFPFITERVKFLSVLRSFFSI